MRVLASAPGKLVLLGEYAVLTGAPAVVMAVDRRARVEIGPGAGDGRSFIDCHSGQRYAAHFELDAGAARWPDACADTLRQMGLVTPILERLAAAPGGAGPGLPALSAHLDTRAFFETASGKVPAKLGLGSSAALTVAFACALAEYTGRSPVASGCGTQLGWLRELHRGFQRGTGSGLDVAASFLGGVIRYRLSVPPEPPEVDRVRLPADLGMLCVWSGSPASTGRYLGRWQAWRERQPEQFAHAMAELSELAVAGVQTLEAADTAGLLELLGAYGNALRRMGEASETDIFGAGHEHIATLARAAGAVYKPSGAGGGDMGIAFSTDDDVLERLRVKLGEAGLRALDLRPDPAGVQLDKLNRGSPEPVRF